MGSLEPNMLVLSFYGPQITYNMFYMQCVMFWSDFEVERQGTTNTFED